MKDTIVNKMESPNYKKGDKDNHNKIDEGFPDILDGNFHGNLEDNILSEEKDSNGPISITVEDIDGTNSSEDSDSSDNYSRELKERIHFLLEKSKKTYDKFNKYNTKIINSSVNDELKMNIKYEKEFKEHLQKKLNKLDNRLNILQMKYNSYKKWYDRFNIMIIMISSILSIYEAFRLEIMDLINEDNEELKLVLNLIPIIISSTITCSAAIIKFKKYQEKMENMQFTREKVIHAISKLKTVQESLWFSKNDSQFEDIKNKYLNDIYIVYNESSSELERHIKFNDHHKFFKMYREPPVEKEKKKINISYL